MYKVKRLKQSQIRTMQEGMRVWKEWKLKYPDDELKQFVADAALEACSRRISIKQLYTILASKEGIFEASRYWADIPRW